MLGKTFWKENGLLIGFAIVLIVVFILLRTRGNRFVSTAEFDAAITSGQPTVVEFFSNT